MDKLVKIRHGGIVRRNDNGDIEFEGMREFSMLLSAWPSYGFLVTKLKERLQWSDEGLDIVMQGVIDVGLCNGPHIKHWFQLVVQLSGTIMCQL
jgi:hypothetical protein